MDYEQTLLDQQEMVKNLLKNNIIERDLDYKKVLKFLQYPNVVAIMGVRRSGKTIFSLKCLEGKRFFYINFDDERLYRLEVKELNKLLEISYKIKDYEYLILDEIQNISGWELFVNRLRNTMKIIVTGSNSNLLSKELATHLTGRHVDIHILPFSFSEHLRMKQISLGKKSMYSTKERALLLREVDEFLRYGGFPERYKFGIEILRFVFEDIINKDMVRREQIKKTREFENFVFYLLTNFTHKLSVKKIVKTMNLNPRTINKWLKILEDGFLIYQLKRFSFKARDFLHSPSKIYLIDNGFVASTSLRFSENKGKLMENCVFIQCLRKKYYRQGIEDFHVFYYEDPITKYEVDFLIKVGTKIKELIQVSYATSYEEIKEREIRGLLHAKQKLGLSENTPLTIITWDYEDEKTVTWWGKEGQIRFVPLWKWLLSPD